MVTKTKEPVAKGQIPAFPELEVIEVEVEEAVVRDLVPIEDAATHHLVVGMGTLAAMSEEDFEAKIAVMQKGQDRIRIIQEKLLKDGEDYGRVKGIERPFLHQPGAEKLANFYGFAVEQIADRIPGDGINEPPLAYHVRSLVHLGDFSGPVIAMGYGEASSWEEKYRYRWSKPACPKCGREGLIKGRKDGKLAGKWWCPGKEGGCNNTFEAADPEIESSHKIDNPDPWSMAETLIQMAAKRSLVASVRRATGTSGLFTQDEDSPSVRQQTGDNSQDDSDPVVTGAQQQEVAVGGKTVESNDVQLKRMVTLSREKDIDKPALVALFKRLFDMTVEETSAAISAAARGLTAEQLGQMLLTMETGEVPAAAPPAMPTIPEGEV